MERRLAAILAADVVGYTRLMGVDEAGTLDRLKALREELIDPEIARHKGRLVKLMGDGALVEFASVVDAVACAVAIQTSMAERNAEVPEAERLEFRIGINLGDVIVEGEDIYGDGVNIAARLEGLAEPGGVCLSDIVHQSVKAKLDLAFEDLGPQHVKNVAEPVRAYRVDLGGQAAPKIAERAEPAKRDWRRPAIAAAVAVAVVVAGVLAWQRPWAPDVEPASIERMAFPLPDKPSIAVLPFDNLSGDPEKEFLSDGLSENIITELSRFKEFFVIARNSTITYKGKPVKVQQVAEELGVRYVLEGSVQIAGDRLRVTAQLIDATRGNHLWAERYDRDLRDIFAVQDEITRTIAATLKENIDLAEYDRILRKPTESLSAYESRKRGQAQWLTFTREGNEQAKRLYEKTLKLDPNYSEAYVGLAWVHINGYRWGWSETNSREESLGLALEMARKSVEMDPFSHRTHWVLANATMQSGDLDRAIAEYDRAIELNPNSARVLADSIEPLVYLGRAQEGIARMNAAIRLNPRHPDWYLWNLGWAQYFAEQYEDALASLKKMNKMPNGARRTLAPVLVRLGRLDEARTMIAEFVQNEPDYSLEDLEATPFEHKEYQERWIEDLRKAGLPDKPPLKLPDKPSIAVLPFNNMSGDPEQEYFADGMTEDLITDLAKVSGLLVIARNSTFAYKGQSPDVREVARELGVRYVVEGSVRKAGGRIRINAQLIDAETGAHLWAERYDREATDVFDLQDEVRARIVAALRVKLTPAEVTRLARQQTDSPEAYDAYLRGQRQESFFTKEGNLESLRLFERAIELDPAFVAAMGRLATAHTLAAENGWSPAPEESMETARVLAEKAVALDDDLPQAHWAVARVYSRKRLFDGDRAIASLRKAIALDPNYADAHAMLSNILNFVGRSEEALGQIEQAMRLNPHFPFWYFYVLGTSQFHLTRYDAAIESFEKAIERNSAWRATHLYLVAAYGHLGMTDEAEWEMEELRTLGFEPTLENWRSRIQIQDPAYLTRYFDGLRKAGVPE